MEKRTNTQSAHDNAVWAAQNMYENHDKHVWINPGSEKNQFRIQKLKINGQSMIMNILFGFWPFYYHQKIKLMPC